MASLLKLGRFSVQWGGDVAGVMTLSSYKGATFYGFTWRWAAMGFIFLHQPTGSAK